MWKCPDCGESLHDYEESCWNCKLKHANAPAQEKTPAGKQDKEAPRMKKCPYCAEEILAEAIKCRYCGSIIEAPQPAAQAPVARARPMVSAATSKETGDTRMAKSAAIAVAIVISALLALWAAFTYIKPLAGMVSGKAKAGSGIDRNVAYEEITEYDGKGNVKKSVKTYPKSKDKPK